ncbi:FadR/GntR family transcriptional regulator [Pseudazoarcus pumilus]|uniref:FadR family transcriptional regulator n=1 Tax=Pseudazoarcus pumilus TaxID=2067960 RepID=A0A2I6S8N4_9RHOO|nr:FCD domain-containing protein [Pseudazoarcus pumilus]AUN95597.1 FadR family transcriptional regulator [Pseudazoarcus pumilus]
MNAPEPVPRATRLSDEVADALEAWLRSEGFAPGTQLPTEKVLCERFGVSRAVIREAIARLKADGCVRTRQGSGAFVAARPGEGVFRLPLPDVLPQDAADVFELRYVVETGAAALAAERREAADLAHIGAALARMREALAAAGDAVVDDDAFHIAIAEATHNRALARFQQFVGQQFSGSRAPTWSAAGHRAGRARDAQREHERIFAAIAAGDAPGARRAAAAHLVGAARRLGLDPARWRALAQEETDS